MFCQVCKAMLKGGKCLNCRPPAVEGPRKGHVNSRLRKLNADGGLDELIISFASAPIALNILVERVKPEAEKKLNKTFTPAGYKILYEVVYKAAQDLVERNALSFGPGGYRRRGT